MSKAPVRRVKRDSSFGGDRISDDEHNRRKISYQSVEKERQKKIAALNELRKNQLGMLQELLSNQRNVKNSKIRPTSAKSVTQSIYSTYPDKEPRARRTRSQSRPRTANTDFDPSLRPLLNRLASELHHLELTTGFKSHKTDSSSCSPSVALANALLGLIGHVRECASSSQEINQLKDRLSMMMRNQLDFQEKIETQVATLQTMMQTICQLVNNEMISKKKDHSEPADTRQSWLDNAQRPYIVEKDTTNAMDELLVFTRRMNNDTPSEFNLRPPSSSNHRHDKVDQPLRLSMISPLEVPLLEAEDKPETAAVSSALPTSSATETILEKILQERLRLVQQMNELNKQHEMTQEELAHLEAHTMKS